MKTVFLVLCAIIKCCLQNSALILGLMPLQLELLYLVMLSRSGAFLLLRHLQRYLPAPVIHLQVAEQAMSHAN